MSRESSTPFEDLEKSAQDRDEATRQTEELAARMASKVHERADEAPAADPVKQEAKEETKDELYAEAQKRDIKGRSTMTKAELAQALGR